MDLVGLHATPPDFLLCSRHDYYTHQRLAPNNKSKYGSSTVHGHVLGEDSQAYGWLSSSSQEMKKGPPKAVTHKAGRTLLPNITVHCIVTLPFTETKGPCPIHEKEAPDQKHRKPPVLLQSMQWIHQPTRGQHRDFEEDSASRCVEISQIKSSM